MKVTQVRVTSSSFIDRIAYDAVKRLLTILFTNGRVYQYAKVGSTVARDFMVAESKGRFFYQNIRDQYESQELAA
jgi:hypothetical protein